MSTDDVNVPYLIHTQIATNKLIVETKSVSILLFEPKTTLYVHALGELSRDFFLNYNLNVLVWVQIADFNVSNVPKMNIHN